MSAATQLTGRLLLWAGAGSEPAEPARLPRQTGELRAGLGPPAAGRAVGDAEGAEPHAVEGQRDTGTTVHSQARVWKKARGQSGRVAALRGLGGHWGRRRPCGEPSGGGRGVRSPGAASGWRWA